MSPLLTTHRWPTVNTGHQSGNFVTINEPTLAYKCNICKRKFFCKAVIPVIPVFRKPSLGTPPLPSMLG